jgi:hypothetical protein
MVVIAQQANRVGERGLLADCLGEKVDQTRPLFVIGKNRLAPLYPGGTVQPGRRPVDSNSRRNFIATPAITSGTFLRYHLCAKETPSFR